LAWPSTRARSANCSNTCDFGLVIQWMY
jgi:hypothetical protein